eukprot:CAMPEP_0176473906 /NCGR_PEP_ID=MMETSP0127-20121128/42624_1 /TAXON_ID=938130 /ORGANISM="Platyophrya macrostoma, Strain WH" /LENGTH=44 /DNA_ID= /DNA_START= /DNA_END= /DNA_ORIENTATION=
MYVVLLNAMIHSGRPRGVSLVDPSIAPSTMVTSIRSVPATPEPS